MRIILSSIDNPNIFLSGGKHVHLKLLEKGLTSIGEDVSMAYSRRQSLLNRIINRVHGAGKRYINRLNYLSNDIKSQLSAMKADVLNSHDVYSLRSSAGLDVARVLTLHGYAAREAISYNDFSERNRKIVFDYIYNIEKVSIGMADRIIAVDSRIKNYVIDDFGYPSDRIDVIYNAVDTDRFIPVDDEYKRSLRKDLGFSDKDFIIVVPRRFVRKNGIEYALKAARILSEEENLKFI
jgi:glycosyltransferase involved in cell wall biosynthesis